MKNIKYKWLMGFLLQYFQCWMGKITKQSEQKNNANIHITKNSNVNLKWI